MTGHWDATTRLRDAIDKSLSIRRFLGRDAEVVEQGLHVEADGFVVRSMLVQVLGGRPRRGVRIPARSGAMSFSRSVSRAVMVRVLASGTW